MERKRIRSVLKLGGTAAFIAAMALAGKTDQQGSQTKEAPPPPRSTDVYRTTPTPSDQITPELIVKPTPSANK